MQIIDSFFWRSTLDVCIVLQKYVNGKTVCDLGCSGGDILEMLKQYNIDVHGYEKNALKVKEAHNYKRYYVELRDIVEESIDEYDVYLVYLELFRAEDIEKHKKIISKLPKNKQIIFLSIDDKNIKWLEKYFNLEIIQIIEYEYDETKYSHKEKVEGEYIYFKNQKYSLKGIRKMVICNI